MVDYDATETEAGEEECHKPAIWQNRWKEAEMTNNSN